MAQNQNLKQLLNDVYARPAPTARGPGKSGRQQLMDNGNAVLVAAEELENWVAEIQGLGPCMLSSASVDGRGRPVRSMRVKATNTSIETKREFRAYHIAWISTFGIIPNASSITFQPTTTLILI